MKYLFFDTNIYLDIATDRNNKINFDLISKFDLLLKRSENIKIILPEIVSFEVHKHLNSEIENIKKNIDEQKKNIDKLYWFPHSETNIEEYKKEAKEPLTKLLDIYNKNENNYKTKTYEIINSIFKNDKTIFIKSDLYLNDKVFKRRIFKKAPLHIEKKESLADGLITETLINLKKYITLQDNDKIYFVTRNTSDFSSKDNKKELHSDIIKDLENINLLNQVLYLNDVKELISIGLQKEIEEAELDFELLLEEKENEKLEMLELEEEDRMSGGLTSLSSYPEYLDIKFSESQEYGKIQNIFEDINSIISELTDEIYYKFEELRDKANEKNLKIYNKNLFSCITYTYQKLCDEYTKLPDCLEIGKNLEFENEEKKNILLEWEDYELSPTSDATDIVSLFLKKDGEAIAKGIIEVYYGYLNFNDDGNADDGCEDSITIEFDSIITELEKIKEEFQDKLNFYNYEYPRIIREFKEVMSKHSIDTEFEYEE